MSDEKTAKSQMHTVEICGVKFEAIPIPNSNRSYVPLTPSSLAGLKELKAIGIEMVEAVAEAR